ncbi:MAG TPA: sugar phosphate isomerase/epimerase [Candidatus Lumbricidophila sp.]|nr:sugar phosphate isomerase/epimerase [Candidatus Lumbricidophila sp.]
MQTSIQLYTLRDALEADLDGTLAQVAARGFTAVEPYDFVRRAEAMAAALAAHGLVAPTGHAMLATTSFVNPDATASDTPVPPPSAVFDAAERLGMTTVIEPCVVPERWQTVDQIRETAELLNAAAAEGAARGIRVGYHNHAHELEVTFDGKTGLEVFAELLDPRVVLEVDLYWVARAGLDGPALLRRLGDRVIALHVKDGTLEAEKTGQYPPTDQVVAGEGNVPLAAAVAAASAVEVAVVEFDFFDGDLFEVCEQSRRFIDGLAA